jgi:DNA invertase Pin-like site-specific DNA recombinase
MSQTDTAVYIRRSTADQETEHQRAGITEWLADRDLAIGDVDVYAEQASGASTDRDEFNELIDAIEAGEYSDVVVWEISRIARKGTLAQQFFDTAEDAGTTIHITNGSVRKVEPDGHGRMVADVIAAVAAEERRSLIRRTEAGLQRARAEGKWVGQTPAGFETVAGYLRPILNPEDGEVGYFELVDAIEAIENGMSYRKAAKRTPNVTRQTLMRIHKDDDRRAWYLDGEADDERVAEALDEIDAE